MISNQELKPRDKQEAQQSGETTREGPAFIPEVDIYEREDALVLVADVPGSSNEQIELDLQDNVLTMTAHVGQQDSKWKPTYVEYEIGHYSRQFRIGHMVDREKISAQVKDGVLTVVLPKVESAMPRKIQVVAQE